MTKNTFIFILLSMVPLFEASAQEKEYTLVWSDVFDVEGEPSKDWSFESGFVCNEDFNGISLIVQARHGFVCYFNRNTVNKRWMICRIG